MDDHLIHTILNHHPKTFVLATKWLVRNSSMSPKTTAMTFAFSSVLILILWFDLIACSVSSEVASCRTSRPLLEWPRGTPGLILTCYVEHFQARDSIVILIF